MTFCLKMKSDYSFMSSTITIDDAVSFCKQNKLTYCSLIDNNLFGAYEFYNKCLKNNIKPILGVELNINYQGNVYPLIFICKSELGYKNIAKMSSLAMRYERKPIEFKTLGLYSQDVIVVFSTQDSYLKFLVENNNIYDANIFIDDLKRIFKDIYLGIYRYPSINDSLISELKEYCLHKNIKSIAMQYATHLNKKDTIILNLLDCIDKNIPINKEFLKNNEIYESYLKTPELLKIYYDREELENLLVLANSTNLKINRLDFSLPEVYLNINPDEKLKELAYQGLEEKKLINNKKYLERTEYELNIISSMGFSNYYLVVADYVNYAKNNDILVGPARGSGGASLVAYLLNITSIDPLKFDLLFERFLNPSRSNYPDFDIDFIDIKRQQVIDYLKEKYGYHNVAHIATFSTFGPKSAIREIAKLFKTTTDDIDYLVKTLSDNAISINDEYKNNKKFKDLLDIHGNFKTICSFASQIEGLKRQVGLHAAGLIISKENLEDMLPCFENDKNTFAISYDYLMAEKLGLIKMDFLGLKNLNIIDYCLKRINQEYQTNLSFYDLDFDNESTYATIQNGQTFGLFQLESKGINNVILQLKPNCFADIVALLALYRPGPMDMIPTYIERKNGQKFDYIDKSLIPILKSTYGIIIYQEQIMKICQIVANFSYAEADIFRRAISKKNLVLLKDLKDKFILGCINNNFAKNKAEQLYSLIEKFANYGFNKAHSVGYGTITSIMAYLKTNYKTIFYEALLNVNNENGERKKELFYEARKNNIEIKYPSINSSSYLFTSTENSIIFGLTNITSIKENIATTIINERNKAKFKDIYDFVIRMVLNNISLKTIVDLTFAGALDDFKIERNVIIANLNNLYNYALMFKDLDYIPNTYSDIKYNSIDIPYLFFKDNENDYLKKEYELLGIYIAIHPLTLLKRKQSKIITDIYEIKANGYYDIIGKIIFIENKKNKNKQDIFTIKIEDDSAIIVAKDFNNAVKNKQLFKKNDVVLANITYKNPYFYLNSLRKMEGE